MSVTDYSEKIQLANNWLIQEIRKSRREAQQAEIRCLQYRAECIERAMRGTTDPKVRAKQAKNLARVQFNIGQAVKELMK